MTQSDAPGQLGDQAVVDTIVERGMENINLCEYVCVCVGGCRWLGHSVNWQRNRRGKL